MKRWYLSMILGISLLASLVASDRAEALTFPVVGVGNVTVVLVNEAHAVFWLDQPSPCGDAYEVPIDNGVFNQIYASLLTAKALGAQVHANVVSCAGIRNEIDQLSVQ